MNELGKECAKRHPRTGPSASRVKGREREDDVQGRKHLPKDGSFRAEGKRAPRASCRVPASDLDRLG